jgi:hypothetical protein
MASRRNKVAKALLVHCIQAGNSNTGAHDRSKKGNTLVSAAGQFGTEGSNVLV